MNFKGGCPHHHTQGDNNGKTCQDCGQVLGGYGFLGQGRQSCLHFWVKSDSPDYLECLYCHRTLKTDLLD